MKTGEIIRTYHQQISEKSDRLSRPGAYQVADQQTLIEVPAILENQPTENQSIAEQYTQALPSTTKLTLGHVIHGDFVNKPTQVAPSIKTFAVKGSNFLRRKKQQESEIIRDSSGTLILAICKSSLPTVELVRQEVLRFWQETSYLPSIIFLSLKRYKETETKYCYVDQYRIPYEVWSDKKYDIMLKRYYTV